MATFVLSIGGYTLGQNPSVRNPVGDFPCTITDSLDGGGQMTFTVEDELNAGITLELGEVVSLLDYRWYTSGIKLFGGHLVETVYTPRPGRGRLIACTCVSYDKWLDWLQVPNSQSAADSETQINSYTTDRHMVTQLINDFGFGIDAFDAMIELTNASMGNISIVGMSLREALQAVADTATIRADTANRKFYVDEYRQLHYYKDVEDANLARFRVGEGSYTTDVLATAGLAALWTMTEGSGATAYGSITPRDVTFAGGYTRGAVGGIPNEPGKRAVAFDGTTAYGSIPTGAPLHPGNTFTFECWFRRGSTVGTSQTIWSNGADDFEVGFNAANGIELRKQADSVVYVTDAAFGNDGNWHHLMITKSGATRVIYVDGVSRVCTGTNATIVASSTDPNIGRRTAADRYFHGWLQHIAIYSTALSAATDQAHYDQGISMVPEGLSYTASAFDGREKVHVAGGNDAGSSSHNGVQPNFPLRTKFGKSGMQPNRAEIIDRPDSKTVAKMESYAAAFLKAHSDPLESVRFTLVESEGRMQPWRAGQLVRITNTNVGLSNREFEIQQISVDVGFGAGVLTYDVDAGAPVWSGARVFARRTRRKR